MDEIKDILLIGGGVASASAAAELRRQGFAGKVTLITRELDAPYHRPPITKQVLRADGADYSVECHSPSWWEENQVEVLTRSAVVDIDTAAQTVTLTNKSVLRYDNALVATGAMVRRLNIEGSGLEGIHYLRATMNGHKLRAEAESAKNIVLVGGSFIAVEVAASLSDRGLHCTLVMQEQKCLERTFGPVVAEHVEGMLRSHGVDIVCGVDVEAFTGESRVTGVRTADGREIHGDLVVVGAGAIPDTKLAVKAGLEIGVTGGVYCDSQLRTSAANVFAAGDMCEYDSVVHGRSIRVEHEKHAMAQGITAARNMLGAGVDHTEVPYFWSEIADWAKLEYVGPARTWDEEIVTGSVEDNDFTVWYLEKGKLVAALTSGRADDLDVARSFIGREDSSRDIKDVLRQAV
jgi:3-phenylpropionate/trans-cinnamate dioxygenase ferredoxin reductase subunit